MSLYPVLRHRFFADVSPSRRRRGFTLVQMLVTILIMAVLLAVAIPLYTQTQKTSKQKACEENLTAIYQAEEAYRIKNRAYLAATTTTDLQTLTGTVPQCPSGSATYTVTVSGSGSSQTVTVWCKNSGAHVTGKYRTFDSSTMTFVNQ